MNLELYKTFYHIAKCESITKAAEQMYITQPAVSRAIRQLEEELGCTLFIRTPKGVKLTLEGSILYQYVDQIFHFLSTAEKKINDVKNLNSGEVRLGVSDTLCRYYLVKYLKLFNTLHPKIKIHVVCPTTPGIISLLKAGKIDFGIINLPYNDDSLHFTTIMEVQDCFVAGVKYRHMSVKMQPLSEIIRYPLLILEKNSNSRAFADQYFLQNGLEAAPDFELGNMDLLVTFAKYDMGIAWITRNFFEDEIASGRLYEIRPIERIPPRYVGVARLKDVPLSRASLELISLLSDNEPAEF
ncbi:LysR family transcriptional regulator [Acetivibrio straminisolvens]|nr:LysR family transcriptional regulator [Acetivibrio straminisolvens]